TQQQIRDISIEVDLYSKQSTQFHNMSNEFEIAFWLAHHKRILDLTINIKDGIVNGINKESDMASTSIYALTQ
ncbi:8789_t:CDS:1, partial [Funneliformis mosseae]